jgi:hypothetical protein
MDKNGDFEDTEIKPSALWTLCDDAENGSIPAGASGGDCNHNAAKHVHRALRARLGQAKIDRGTSICKAAESPTDCDTRLEIL